MAQDKEVKKVMVSILTNLLLTSIEVMSLYKLLASDEKSKEVCKKSIRNAKKALKIVPTIRHNEILYSIYNTLIGGKENIFALSGTIICSSQLKRWDTTEEGFKEFQEIEKQAQTKQREKNEENEKNRKILEEAKKSGKKVEIVYDKGVAKPIIIEDKETVS